MTIAAPRCLGPLHLADRPAAVQASEPPPPSPRDLPPTALAAERACLSMALALGRQAPRALWSLRASDFTDIRHRELWPIARRAAATGAQPDFAAALALAPTLASQWGQDQAEHDATVYLLHILAADWPTDPTKAVASIRLAACLRTLSDSVIRLSCAWADDDKTALCRQIDVITSAAKTLLAEATT